MSNAQLNYRNTYALSHARYVSTLLGVTISFIIEFPMIYLSMYSPESSKLYVAFRSRLKTVSPVISQKIIGIHGLE